ncbi:hypothetical protein ACUNV4_17110 [Granulosicoccus sp. 3-233]|uniref:hypothetical protein n=1 Tax=Granulosicoccus sp. 3-233 TaxID=3417969 RepID=UPI003D334267
MSAFTSTALLTFAIGIENGNIGNCMNRKLVTTQMPNNATRRRTAFARIPEGPVERYDCGGFIVMQ